MTQIGKNIKKIRNVKGLSQQAFAELFSLSRGNISSYEEYRAEPKIDTVVRIANYFGIPLTDFIEKELSVNELLHYNTRLVVETEKLKIGGHLVNIPYVPSIYIKEFALRYNDEEFFHKLPNILVPGSSRFRLIALEMDNPEDLPAGRVYQPGDVLVFEQIGKENFHRITGKPGMITGGDGIKWGIYSNEGGKISLRLNEWVEYLFDISSTIVVNWVLRAVYSHVL